MLSPSTPLVWARVESIRDASDVHSYPREASRADESRGVMRWIGAAVGLAVELVDGLAVCFSVGRKTTSCWASVGSSSVSRSS